MEFLVGLLGISFSLGLSWVISSNRKLIKKKPILLLLFLEFILVFLLLNTGIGKTIITSIANSVAFLFAAAYQGIDFVFGGLTNEGVASQFFLNVLMPMVFISTLVGILEHIRILPFIINWIGIFFSKFNGLGTLESYSGVAYPFLSSGVFVSFKTNFLK